MPLWQAGHEKVHDTFRALIRASKLNTPRRRPVAAPWYGYGFVTPRAHALVQPAELFVPTALRQRVGFG